MPREWTPSEETFASRLHYMVEDRGIQAVADRYSSAGSAGSRRRTVRRWLRGETRPSANVRRSVARSGRSSTGPALRTPVGYIIDPRMRRLAEVQREQRAAERRAALQEARTPSQQAMAQAMDDEPDYNEIRTLEQRRRRMLEADYRGDEYWDDSWDDWRDDVVSSYEMMAG